MTFETPGEFLLESGYKLQLAREVLPLSESEVVGALDDWLANAVPWSRLPDDLELGVSLTADLQHLTWRAASHVDDAYGALTEYLTGMELADEAEIEELEEVGRTLEAERLGGWIELSGEHLNVGWFLPGSFPVSQALEFAPPGWSNATIEKWADNYPSLRCLSFGRSLGVGNPYYELQLELPGSEAEKRILAALSLYNALKMADPPDEVLSILLNFPPESEMRLSLWMTQFGLSRIGLLAAKPETQMLLRLLKALDLDNWETLAKFEGLLQVETGSTFIETYQLGVTTGLELHYTLPVKKQP
jgi:hypothetical protein